MDWPNISPILHCKFVGLLHMAMIGSELHTALETSAPSCVAVSLQVSVVIILIDCNFWLATRKCDIRNSNGFLDSGV